GDGGVPDPNVGFYEWVVFSPKPVKSPSGKEPDNLPLEQSVPFVEAKMPGHKVEKALKAFSTGWEANGFAFSGTWIRAEEGDYLVVQESRKGWGRAMTIPFLILSVVTVAGAIAAVALRNLVHCALCLVLTFAGLAGLFLQLNAEFVGFVQILVYIGAVAIL